MKTPKQGLKLITQGFKQTRRLTPWVPRLTTDSMIKANRLRFKIKTTKWTTFDPLKLSTMILKLMWLLIVSLRFISSSWKSWRLRYSRKSMFIELLRLKWTTHRYLKKRCSCTNTLMSSQDSCRIGRLMVQSLFRNNRQSWRRSRRPMHTRQYLIPSILGTRFKRENFYRKQPRVRVLTWTIRPRL